MPGLDSTGAPRQRAIVAIAVAAVTIDAALLGLIAPLLPAIEERTGAGEGELGVALAAYAIPIALLSLPLGRAADVLGRRVLLVGGLVLIAGGSGLIAASDSLAVLIAARAVQGVGSAASWIAALALVSDTAAPEKRGQALGVALGATGVGSIAGPALGGVAADTLSFEAPFLIACGFALVLLVAALVISRVRCPARVRQSRRCR
jgi:MFS family permease